MSFRRRSAATAVTKRVGWAPLTIAAGVVATGAVALSMTGTLAAFTAQITNSANTAASGTLTLSETYTNGQTTTTCTSTDGGSVSTNAATCSTINKYGGSTTLVPGGSSTTTVVMKNTGTAAAGSFTLTGGTCTQGTNGSVNGSATDLCDKMTVAVYEGPVTGTALYNGSLTGFKNKGANTLTAPAAGASQTYNFVVTLPAGLGNTYQGLSASQPMTWNLTAGS